MNVTRAIVFACVVVAGPAAQAASVHVTTPNATNDRVFAVFLEGGADNGNFDTLVFQARPDAPDVFAFVNTGAVVTVRPPGQQLTYRNILLNSDPADFPGGLNWTLLGIVNTNTSIAFTGGPLGQKISTADQPDGRLFLANFYLPTGSARGMVQLISAGTLVQQFDFVFPIPEPTGVSLAAAAIPVAFAVVRRRNRS